MAMNRQDYFKLAIGVLCLFVTLVHASGDELQLDDSIELKSGTQLSGKIIARTEENGRQYLVFKTTSGGVLKLDTRRLVKRVNEVDPQYQELLAKMDDASPDAHWKMYEWCKGQDNGSSYKREMDYHLTRIVELDNTDEKAVRLLDNDRFGGKIRNLDHQFEGHGYTKVTGGWIPTLLVANMEAERQQEEMLAQRRSALKLWQRQLGRASVADLQKELNAIVDASMVGDIYERAVAEKDPGLRVLYINAIGQVISGPAQSALVFFAINDDNVNNRERALTLLLQPHYNPAASANVAAGFLKSNENVVVRRAANVLRELGQINVVDELADALVTTHEVLTGNDPNRTTAGQQTGGNGAGSFNFGGGPAKVKTKVQNPEVLDALRTITKQSFGPDPRMWKAWYTRQYTIEQIDLRSGE
jgi:hypothetical protein